MNTLKLLPLIGGLLLLGCGQQPEQTAASRPNIVLIMGDDIGFSDIGCYGSEIPTPNLDKLAQNGMRFTTFYNQSKCETTRSSIFTGLHGKVPNTTAINFAKLLGDSGYKTVACGKEHFAKWVPKSVYSDSCFDYSLHFWATNEFFIPPSGEFERPFYLQGELISAGDLQAEKTPFYKTDVVTDYALRYLEQTKQDGKPFFLYMPYHAAHYPLQARPEDIAKFRGKYRKGWDTIRAARFEKQKQLGIVGADWELSQPTDNINKFRGHPKGDEERRAKIPLYRPWESLSAEEQDELDLEMAVFAAMVYRMDLNIGRIVEWLKANGKYENTIILYLNDNGSCPFDSNRDFEHPPGPATGYRTLSAAWANVGNTPFRFFKQFGHEGGTRTPFVVHWPNKIEQGSITDQVGHVTDLYPTLLEVAQVPYPKTYKAQPTPPLHGKSLMPIFTGGTRPDPEFVISGFTDRFRMFRQGEWKLVKANDGDWELYHLANDPTESRNLADSQSEKLQEMIAAYQKSAQGVETLP